MLSKGRPKKLSTPKQKKIIELFHNLFSSGFHLAEIVDFLRRSALLEEAYVAEMRAGLSADWDVPTALSPSCPYLSCMGI